MFPLVIQHLPPSSIEKRSICKSKEKQPATGSKKIDVNEMFVKKSILKKGKPGNTRSATHGEFYFGSKHRSLMSPGCPPG
ncbi:MAG: hypothetical protein JWQ09_3987 [Segetibacter sp.]|nr:hypothetical protein [Segetibacter sp.]